jgi:hypothetical protein
MAKNLFDHIKGVTKDKIKWETLADEDQKSWNNFIITRWFSMEMELTDAMNDFQKYSNGILTSKDYYKLLHDGLPKSSFFLKYIKRKTKIEIDQEFIQIFVNHFQLGKKVIYDYITDLQKINPNELISILESYGTKKEDIEKFKKQIKTIK